MITRLPAHYGDDTCSSCVRAGDFLFLAHHGGSLADDLAQQTRETFQSMQHTLEKMGANLSDMVQITYYIKSTQDFRRGADVFREFFPNGAPARMTVVTDFIDPDRLCQMDGIAYRPTP